MADTFPLTNKTALHFAQSPREGDPFQSSIIKINYIFRQSFSLDASHAQYNHSKVATSCFGNLNLFRL